MVAPEHLLLGLVGEEGGAAVALLARLGLSGAAVRAELRRQLAGTPGRRADGGRARAP